MGAQCCPRGIHRLLGKANHTCGHTGISKRVSYGTEDRPGNKQMLPGREVAKKRVTGQAFMFKQKSGVLKQFVSCRGASFPNRKGAEQGQKMRGKG